MTTPPGPRWQACLAYAALGHIPADLPESDTPDLEALFVAFAHLPGGLADVRATVQMARERGPWPHPVPPELRAGIGYAQLDAVLRRVQSRLLADESTPGPVLVDRPLTADERRLTADAPPHHGS